MNEIIDHFDKHYKEVSVAEFFLKNRQMLGYTGPIKSLTVATHELLTNALDATEEIGVLPDIKIKIDQLGERYHRLTVRDNGPGIPKEYIGKLFGKMLSGTKFHRFLQSLAPDEPILIKKDKKVKIISIGEFCDKFLKEEGSKDVSDLCIKVPSFDWVSYKYAWRPVTHVIKHRRKAKIYKLTTERGKQVKVTDCHSLFTLNENFEVKPIEVSSLRKGDYLIAPLRLPQSNGRTKINVLNFVDPKDTNRRWFVYGIDKEVLREIIKDSKEIKKQIGNRRRTIYRVNGTEIRKDTMNYIKWGFLPLELVLRLGLKGKVGNCVLRTYMHGDKTEIPISWEINPSLMRFIGLCVAEGHYADDFIGFTFNPKELEFVREVRNTAEDLFGVSTTLIDRGNNLRVREFGSFLAYLMKRMCGEGAHEKIPEFVLNCSKQMKIHFLDALINGDGFSHKTSNQLTLRTTNNRLANHVSYLWSSLGIPASFRKRKGKPRILPGGYKANGPSYDVSIYGESLNISHYYQTKFPTRGSTYPRIPAKFFRKIRKLVGKSSCKGKITISRKIDEMLVFGGFGQNSESVKKNLRILRVLKSKSRSFSEILCYFDKEEMYSELLVHYLNRLKENGFIQKAKDKWKVTKKAREYISLVDNMLKFAKSDLALVKIKKKEEVNKDYEYVYDLSVRGTENFVGGTGWLSVHNSRGQLGLGAAGVILYSQLTSGKPTRIISKTENGPAIQVELIIDTEKNVPKIVSEEKIDGFSRGTEISVELEDTLYSERMQGVYEYVRRTALANPHARITLIDPEGKKTIFERAIDETPPKPKETKPHPHGITAEDLLRMASITSSTRIRTMLESELSRMTRKKTDMLGRLTGIDLDKKPSELTREEARSLVRAIERMKFMAPPTDCLVPIGETQIRKSLEKTLDPEYLVVVERSPIAYKGGIPFQVEVGIAYGGKAGREVDGKRKAEILRFGNRAPLTFDSGACVITEAIESINWDRYGLKNWKTCPVTFFINVSSTHIPFLSTGKQAIASSEEILNELRNALMEGGRKLNRFFRKEYRRKKLEKKMNLLEKYLPIIVEDAAKLAEVKKPSFEYLFK